VVVAVLDNAEKLSLLSRYRAEWPVEVQRIVAAFSNEGAGVAGTERSDMSAVDCPCGYGKGLASNTLVCPVCGLDQSPLHNLNRTVSAVGARVMWSGVMMFCVGVLLALTTVATTQLLLRQTDDRKASSPPHQVPPSVARHAESKAAPAPETAVIRYVVKPGDSWWRIAAVHYGDGTVWRYAAGPLEQRPTRLLPGQVIELRPITIVPK